MKATAVPEPPKPPQTPELETASRLRTKFALHPLQADEIATCHGMLQREKDSKLLIMPTHHVNDLGDLSGFRSDCTPNASGVYPPVIYLLVSGSTALQARQVRVYQCRAGCSLDTRLPSAPTTRQS